MSLDTDFNVDPFFDDFDEDKQFGRILFRPAVPVQARELTQAQTILQNQIERFGSNVYQEGTIIKGVSFSFDNEFFYVKLDDLRVDGQPLNAAQHDGQWALGANNLLASIVDTEAGLQSQDPNLNTFFVKYVNNGTDAGKAFVSTETLNLYPTKADADAVIGGGDANTARVAQVKVADSASHPLPAGKGFAFSVTDGVIFQKGFFSKVDTQTKVVSKYTNLPDAVAVGFDTVESIVNNSIDSSLLDNAQGFENLNAPGAFRLKLEPTLVVKLDTDNKDNFFALAEWENGRVVRQRQLTEFAAVGREMARRTAEESGNYVLKPFTISSEAIASNATHFSLVSGAGVGYVNGHRVEQLASRTNSMRQGTDEVEHLGQTISVNYGNYVIVDELAGTFEHNLGKTVSLRDTAKNAVSAAGGSFDADFGSVAGAEIGTARLLSVKKNGTGVDGTPTAQYRLYITNIQMNAGKNFSNIKSIAADGTNQDGVADPVLESSAAVLKESGFKNLVFPFGQKAIKTLTDIDNIKYTYRSFDDTVSFAQATGRMTVSLGGTDKWPFGTGAQLNETQEQQLVIVAREDMTQTVSGNSTSAGTTVTGDANSDFQSDYFVGDHIRLGANTARITAIANTISLTTADSITGTNLNNQKAWPNNAVVAISNRTGVTANVDATGQILTVDLGGAIDAAANATIISDVRRDTAKQLNKLAKKDIFIKIDTGTHANANLGPWSLGIPDVYQIQSVRQAASEPTDETDPDVTSKFRFFDGMNDGFYGLSRIELQPGQTVASNDWLLLKVSVFDHDATGGGIGFFTVDSYPTDDVTVSLPTDKIRTQDIPLYQDSFGRVIDLRDSVDARPAVSNTAALSVTIGTANTNPSSTETMPGTELNVAAPDSNFITDLRAFLGRIDTVAMDSYGEINVTEGVPTIRPIPLPSPSQTMLLGHVSIPPFPTLTTQEGANAGRPDLTVLTSVSQQKRFTMAGIGNLEQRITNLEYYSSLTLLEKQASDLFIPNATGGNRFKNGLFVDTFADQTTADIQNAEFKIGYDIGEGAIQPKFSQFVVDLEVDTSVNVSDDNGVITLVHTDLEMFNQPFATRVRNGAESFWRWTGTASLVPDNDLGFETRNNPVPVTTNPVVSVTTRLPVVNQTVPMTIAPTTTRLGGGGGGRGGFGVLQDIN